MDENRIDDVADQVFPEPVQGEEKVSFRRKYFGWVRKVHVGGFIVVAFLVFVLPVLLRVSQQKTQPKPKAAGEQATFSFSPGSAQMPPGLTEEVRLDSGTEPIGFVSVAVTFDPARVKLSGEVTTTDLLKTVVQKSSMATANSTGRVQIVLGLSTDDRANPPSGDFQVASIPFVAVSSAANDEAVLNIDLGGTQVVNMDSTVLTVGVEPATLTLNPQVVQDTQVPPEATPEPSVVPDNNQDQNQSNQNLDATETPVPTDIPVIADNGNNNNSAPGLSQASAPVCDSAVPVPPTITNLTRKGASVVLTWNKVNMADHYSIVYGVAPGFYQYGVANTGNVGMFTISALDTRKTYYFAIRAVNNCMPSALSVERFVVSSLEPIGSGGTVRIPPSPTLALRNPEPTEIPLPTLTPWPMPTIVVPTPAVSSVKPEGELKGDLNLDGCVNFGDMPTWFSGLFKGGKFGVIWDVFGNWHKGCSKG